MMPKVFLTSSKSLLQLLLLLLWLLIFKFDLYAQEESKNKELVVLDYRNVPLNEVLIDLNLRYQIQISINATESRACLVYINKSFTNIDQALNSIAKSCDFTVTKVNEVYSFRAPTTIKRTANPADDVIKRFLYQGEIVDAQTKEPIPFAQLLFGNTPILSDQNGRFTVTTNNPNEFVQSYALGYKSIDSLVQQSNVIRLPILPNIIELSTVDIEANEAKKVSNIGLSAGFMQFNDVQKQVIPGQTNNVVFNQLRLYPGILANGEPSTDYVIWGSYAGQNLITYDGITLFSNWGINNDVGRINASMIKSLTVLKGGYNVDVGNRVGGVLQIDGRQGNMEKFSGELISTNQITSAYLNVPILKNKSALQIAGRKTYFGILELTNEKISERQTIIPLYDFVDVNVKYSHKLNDKDKLQFSFILSDDKFKGQIKERPNRQGRILKDINASSNQIGSSLQYFKTWNKGGLSRVNFSYSAYSPSFESDLNLQNILSGGNNSLRRDFPNRPTPPQNDLSRTLWDNNVRQIQFNIDHLFSSYKAHQFKIGVAYDYTETKLKLDISNLTFDTANNQMELYSVYLKDHINISNKLLLDLGARVDLPSVHRTPLVQPRLGLNYKINDAINTYFNAGQYIQYLSRNPVIDQLNNRADVWMINNAREVPILNAYHFVFGQHFAKGSFEIGTEFYSKSIEDISRFRLMPNGRFASRRGDAQIYGADIFVSKKIRTHEIFTSYTYANVIEKFDTVVGEMIIDAAQNQPHELKAGLVLNFKNLKSSLTHVWASGTLNEQEIDRRIGSLEWYNRTDFAMQYSFRMKKFNLDVGGSILNLFNVENIRLNQSVNIPDGEIVNTSGVPFTPTLFLKFSTK